MYELNSTMESEKERISELEERAVETTSIRTLEKKNRLKKRASGPMGLQPKI